MLSWPTCGSAPSVPVVLLRMPWSRSPFNPELLRQWVRRDQVSAGGGDGGAVTRSERDELKRLRKQVGELELEKEILSKAA